MLALSCVKGAISREARSHHPRCAKLTFDSELFYDRGNHYEFVSMAQELASGGELRQAQTYDFTFKNVEKQYESYSGINVKLR